jgi:hypothetical protein
MSNNSSSSIVPKKILCTNALNENGPKISLTQISPLILKCKGKLYSIEKEYQSIFHLQNCITVNPQDDGLYTMFYIEDGTCDETWHDRLKGDYRRRGNGSK